MLPRDTARYRIIICAHKKPKARVCRSRAGDEPLAADLKLAMEILMWQERELARSEESHFKFSEGHVGVAIR
jgi:hypothetical protein